MSNTGKIVLIGGSVVIGGVLLAKKLISANNLQTQISFYLANVTGNASLDTLKKGRIEIATTLRIINGSDISIPFSIAQAQIIYKNVAIAVSKPDVDITLGANSTTNKTLTFEVPLTALGIQSDLITDFVKSIFTTGGITAKIASIMNTITPNISISVTAKVNGVAVNTTKSLEPIPTTKGISLSAGERTVEDGKAYNKYFRKSSRTNITLKRDGDIPDVVSSMVRIVETHYHETDEIAQFLKGKSTLETSRNIWNFSVKYLRYHNDRFGVEELRTPTRSWYDGQISYYQNGESESGIDCDDFAMFCGCILHSLGIPFHFRITKYYNRPYFQHVYLYIPNGDNGKDIIIDPVVDAFNYEKPYTGQEDDFNMASLDRIGGLSGIPIQMLEGAEQSHYTPITMQGIAIEMLEGNNEYSDLYHILNGTDFDGIDDNSLGDTKQAEDAVYQYLLRTRRVIASKPQMISTYSSDPAIILSMFDKAIENYYTPQRDVVMEALAKFEDKLAKNGTIQGIDNELGGFFKNIGKAIKKVHSVAVKVTKKAIAVTGKVLKAVLVTFNPLFIVVRNGMLLAMKLNLFYMSKKIQYGFLSEAQAKANGIDLGNWQKAVHAKNTLMSIFTKLGGKEDNMKNAILKGRSAEAMTQVKGFGELGVLPVAVAAAMTALAPVISLAAKLSDGVKKVADAKAAVTSLKSSVTSLVPSSVVSTAQSLISPERKNEINVLMNNSSVKSVADAKTLVDSGMMKASELYNTMTPASRANLTPESSNLLTKMLVNEAFAKGSESNAKQNNSSVLTRNNGIIEQQNNDAPTNSEVTQSNSTNMADQTTTGTQTFFQKNKKPIFIAGGLLVLALGGVAIYAVATKSDKKPQQIAQRPTQNREATSPQGLGGVRPKYKTKPKKRRQIGGVAV